ncbi:MAG TPA: molybdopterin molybdotransferase MoeA [Synechococcales cyanobacterium M55_K2018_004]|nr:molybdopterin molybdotransferase MoeA [Synechococcales cyanobacterium M55_K2018_004]
MIPVLQAESVILDLVHPLDAERDVEVVSLHAAVGRILANPITSNLDFPHWDNSAMDGYAVQFTDVEHACPENPVTLEVVEEIPAGCQPQKTLLPGQAARILTGSMMPAGADTVVMQEVTRRQGNRVIILAAPQPQQFVRKQGEFYRAGTTLLPAGTRLTAAAIATLAAAQCCSIPVYRRPRVAILSTGNELVAPEQPLQPGQIVDSNQYALAALVAQSGAEPICLGIVPDEPAKLAGAIAQALTICDLVISSGGVSVGDYDYVEQILTSLGATLHIRSVAIKPGKPLTVASVQASVQESSSPGTVLYFGLPGNPVSALVTFWRFVQPALRKLSGLPAGWRPQFVKAKSCAALRADPKRESYLWGHLRVVNGEYEFSPAPGGHSSGNLINLALTNCLAVVPQGEGAIAAEEVIQVMQLQAL